MVQVSSADPNAMTAWLQTNGYAIPDDGAPMIAAYVAEEFDFVALNLAPGQGGPARLPVRVTVAGPVTTLPLRMVAGGTGATVPITLWLLGEGVYLPQNFPSFVIFFFKQKTAYEMPK